MPGVYELTGTGPNVLDDTGQRVLKILADDYLDRGNPDDIGQTIADYGLGP